MAMRISKNMVLRLARTIIADSDEVSAEVMARPWE